MVGNIVPFKMRQTLQDTGRSNFNIYVYFLKHSTAQVLLRIFAMYSVTKAFQKLRMERYT